MRECVTRGCWGRGSVRNDAKVMAGSVVDSERMVGVRERQGDIGEQGSVLGVKI